VLVFCDEPTSGLDSQAAWGVVQFLRKLADAGQSILCTIHQPSAVLFEQFDRLLLLQKGGKTVYFGDTGEGSRTLINYFERNGGTECPPDANPAEYILEQIGAGATASANRNWHDVISSTFH
jgi:ATP-binding cassette, subfamily G (WHITE), member 2, SNQ2